MNERTLAITIGDTQTLYAAPGPQDQDQLTELFGNGPTIQLREAEGDVEGHALADEVLVDVEGHAIALRLPTPADAAALRRALTVSVVTATLVGAGMIASLQSPAAPAATTIDTTRSAITQEAPAQMVRADQDQALREQSYANAQAAAQAAAIAESRSEIPTAEDRADRAAAVREQGSAGSQATSQSTAQDVESGVPAPAQRADEAENLREQSYTNQDK
jgi:hypothetical protein